MSVNVKFVLSLLAVCLMVLYTVEALPGLCTDEHKDPKFKASRVERYQGIKDKDQLRYCEKKCVNLPLSPIVCAADETGLRADIHCNCELQCYRQADKGIQEIKCE